MNTTPRRTTALFMLTGWALLTSANALSPARHYVPPPDSYLRYSVYSVNQLIQEVQNDPMVRQRYAQQFQIPESQVGAYMRHNLVESWVPQSGAYSVYCVNRTGKVFAVKQNFRKGTKVFALRNGEPVMKWLCGNPLMRYHADLAMSNVVRQKVSPSIQALTPTDVSPTIGVVTPGETIADLPTVAAVSVPVGASSVFPSGLLAAAPLLGLAFISNNGGGGGGGTTTSTPRVIPAVPEPAVPALLLAAFPMAVLAAVRRRVGTLRP